MIDQDLITQQLSNHLSGLDKTVTWALTSAVVFAWSAIQETESVKFLGLEIFKSQAFFVAAVFYSIINLQILVRLIRIEDILTLTHESYQSKVFTTLSTHSSLVNPYAFFGSRGASLLQSGFGIFFLIFSWWVFNTSLYLLMETGNSWLNSLLLFFFLNAGLLSLLTASRTRNKLANQFINKSIGRTSISAFRWSSVAGILSGAIFCLVTNKLLSTQNETSHSSNSVRFEKDKTESYYSLGGKPNSPSNNKDMVLAYSHWLLKSKILKGISHNGNSQLNSRDIDEQLNSFEFLKFPNSYSYSFILSLALHLENPAQVGSIFNSLGTSFTKWEFTTPQLVISSSALAMSSPLINVSQNDNEQPIMSEFDKEIDLASQRSIHLTSSFLTLVSTAKESSEVENDVRSSIRKYLWKQIKDTANHSTPTFDSLQQITHEILLKRAIVSTHELAVLDTILNECSTQIKSQVDLRVETDHSKLLKELQKEFSNDMQQWKDVLENTDPENNIKMRSRIATLISEADVITFAGLEFED